jgi:hypothetical protein
MGHFCELQYRAIFQKQIYEIFMPHMQGLPHCPGLDWDTDSWYDLLPFSDHESHLQKLHPDTLSSNRDHRSLLPSPDPECQDAQTALGAIVQ